MPDADLVRRVEMLEKNVESLQKLPSQMKVLTRRVGRVERQILQLRTEMHEEFSAVRGEMKEELAAVRREMATKGELAAARDELRTDIAGMGRDLAGAISELACGQSRIRVLIEDVQARLQIRDEGRP